MSAHPLAPRFAIFAAAGATVLSVAALAVSAPAHADGDRAIGPIASVSGNTFQISQPGGTTSVAFTDATTVTEAVPAQLSDVTVGSCIKAGPAEGEPATDNAITAHWVLISTAVDGKCPQRPGAGAAPAGTPDRHRGVRGIVNSVAGDTVHVTRTDSDGITSPATVTVTDATNYKRRVPASAQAISQGKCAAARGSKDDSGVLQATRVTVWASTDGNCPQPTG